MGECLPLSAFSAGPDVDPMPEVDAMLREARRLFDAGELAAARRVADRACLPATDGTPSAAQVRFRLLHADCDLADSRLDTAAGHASAALATARALDDDRLVADSLMRVARLGFEVADFEQALVDLEGARGPALASGDDRLLFSFLTFLGNIHLSLDQHDVAIASGEDALAVAERLGDPRSLAVATGNLAGRWFTLGERLIHEGRRHEGAEAVRRAIPLSDRAIDLAIRAGAHRLNLSHFVNHVGMLILLGQDDAAMSMLARHRDLVETLGQEGSMSAAYRREAEIAHRRGDAARAAFLLEAGIASAERHEVQADLPDLHEMMSVLHEEAGRYEAALRSFKQMHRLRLQILSAGADRRARVMTARLETERAMRDAAEQRQRADLLHASNVVLVRQTESLAREALEDALTLLPNRRQLDLRLGRLRAEQAASETARPFCIAVLDLDHFKKINDAFSHLVGDKVLQEFGHILRRQCRDEDLPARTGGEEFVVVFAAGLVQAALACERIRVAVESHAWDCLAPALAVTVSIGVAPLLLDRDASESLAAADALLYVAKEGGRNRVRSSGG